MRSDALVSQDGQYRYWLTRAWGVNRPLLPVCMVNPSTADAWINDPTILALCKIAARWGFDGLYVVNLFALRSSSPAALRDVTDPIGPENEKHISDALDTTFRLGIYMLAAWGNNGTFCHRSEWMKREAKRHGVKLVSLGLTKDGHPKHPLARGLHRIAPDQVPEPFK